MEFLLIGIGIIITVVIAISVFISNSGDDKDDGGFDPHSG
jgi:hypothetical protein